jgi:hypothetical protein
MNSYEASEVFELGNAQNLILGTKDAGIADDVIGPNFQTLPNDIDESDE